MFLTLLILTFFNENLLINLYISNDKPVIWYLGFFGTILAINKSMTVSKYSFSPSQKMKRLRKYIPELPKEWESFNSKHKDNFKHFLKLYQNKLIILLKECLYTIATPFIILQLRSRCDKIVDYIFDNIENHYLLGHVCKKSIFTDIEILKRSKKTQFSFVAFQKSHPNWRINDIMMFNINDTVNSMLYDNMNTIIYQDSVNLLPKQSFMFDLSSSAIIGSGNNVVSTIQENNISLKSDSDTANSDTANSDTANSDDSDSNDINSDNINNNTNNI